MDTEDIAEALALDYERDKTLVDALKARIDARLDSLKLAPMDRVRAEMQVKQELGAWQDDFMLGQAPLPGTTDAWQKGVDACLAKAERGLEDQMRLRARMEAEISVAYEAREEQYQKEAARMDQDAAIKMEEFSEETAPTLLRHADMDEVVAARLGKNDAVGTSALASCTGVSLYDPKTGVGAVMHVYQGKITIEDALKAMRAQDSSIKASDLQVTLMPGTAKGVNMSHLESLHDQLETAGITQVRDFSKEGRTSSTLMLRGDGMVISTSEADKLSMAPSVGSPGARARSDSVDSVDSLGPPPPQVRPEDLPPLPDTPEPDDLEVENIMARSRSFSDVSPPPRPPSNLPPLPDTPEPDDLEVENIMGRSRSFSDLSPPPRPPSNLPPLPDTPEPEDLEVASIMARRRSSSDVSPPPRPPSNLPPLPDTPEPDSPDVSNAPEGRARSPSVREALAMGRSRQNSPSEGLGQGGVSTGGKIKQ